MIVLIEDNDELRAAVAEFLAARGVPVRAYAAAEAAVCDLGEIRDAIELVITDFELPGMSGLDFVGHLRAQAPAVPVIVMSSHSEYRIRAAAPGIDEIAYLQKPVPLARLAAAVATAMAATHAG